MNCTTECAAMIMNTLITLEVKFYSAVLCEGLGHGLEFFKKVLTTTLVHSQPPTTSSIMFISVSVCGQHIHISKLACWYTHCFFARTDYLSGAHCHRVTSEAKCSSENLTRLTFWQSTKFSALRRPNTSMVGKVLTGSNAPLTIRTASGPK